MRLFQVKEALHKLNQAEHTNVNSLYSKDTIRFVRLWVQILHEAITYEITYVIVFIF